MSESPNRAAAAFIARTNAGTDPERCTARTLAASFAEAISAAAIIWRAVTRLPARRPIVLPGTPIIVAVTANFRSSADC